MVATLISYTNKKFRYLVALDFLLLAVMGLSMGVSPTNLPFTVIFTVTNAFLSLIWKGPWRRLLALSLVAIGLLLYFKQIQMGREFKERTKNVPMHHD
jgi:hypothetical protein